MNLRTPLSLPGLCLCICLVGPLTARAFLPPPPPQITNQPVSQIVAAGGAVTLTVGAQSFTPLRYQWSKDSAPIAGATNSTLVLTNIQLTSGGNYYVSVINSG